MLRPVIHLTLLALFLLAGSGQAAVLEKIAKVDSRDSTQLFFTFDSLPKYSSKLSSKRLDILLEGTEPASDMQLFAADDRIIRVAPSQTESTTVISLFFRYQPQKFNLTISSDGKLVLDILLGNSVSRSYHNLSERLKGLTVVEEETVDYSNPLRSSPYAYDWLSFIRTYESPVQINVAVDFTDPPFPIITLIPPGLEQNAAILPAEIIEEGKRGEWNKMVPQLQQLLESTTEMQKRQFLALTSGEALLRSANFDGAYRQLYLLGQQYPSEHVGILARYLLVLLEARFRDPYLADYDFQGLEKSISPGYPLAPYLLLSRVETALATKQFNQVRLLLNRDDIAFPGTTQKLRELRQGDYYSGTAELIKAYVSYTLLRDSALLKSHPYSLNGYCNSIYRQKKFDQAATCFDELAPQISDPVPLGLISYKAQMAKLHASEDRGLIAGFARIEDAFPGTEAASRAAIKQVDLKVEKNRNWRKQAAEQYRRIADHAVHRSPAAEAYFKEVLLTSLAGENDKSIDLLMVFLRNFRTTAIRDTAQALLIDLLPREIKKLIKDGDYLEALVLAKKNRDIFQNNWLDLGLMADIATAYLQLGLYQEAQKTYIYLLEMADPETRQTYFLPLIQATFNQGDYNQVEDFSSQYNYNYPQGEDRLPILVYHLKALVSLGRFAEARKLLPTPLPDQKELLPVAAEISFHDAEYGATRKTLDRLIAEGGELSLESQLRLAESRFQLGDLAGAETLFTTFIDNDSYGQQALYRLAQIARSQGDEQKALKLFGEIVEKGGDGLWKTFAQKELEYARLTTSIEQLVDG